MEEAFRKYAEERAELEKALLAKKRLSRAVRFAIPVAFFLGLLLIFTYLKVM